MADDNALTDDERAELERLRAEKADRERAAERAELERLRAEAAVEREREAADARVEKIRERNRKIMEPDDDDLRMPLAQKLVLGIAILLMVAFAFYTLGRH